MKIDIDLSEKLDQSKMIQLTHKPDSVAYKYAMSYQNDYNLLQKCIDRLESGNLEASAVHELAWLIPELTKVLNTYNFHKS